MISEVTFKKDLHKNHTSQRVRLAFIDLVSATTASASVLFCSLSDCRLFNSRRCQSSASYYLLTGREASGERCRRGRKFLATCNRGQRCGLAGLTTIRRNWCLMNERGNER